MDAQKALHDRLANSDRGFWHPDPEKNKDEVVHPVELNVAVTTDDHVGHHPDDPKQPVKKGEEDTHSLLVEKPETTEQIEYQKQQEAKQAEAKQAEKTAKQAEKAEKAAKE